MKKHISLALAITIVITTLFTNVVFASFPDVTTENRYYNAILTLQSLKVIDGDEKGNFNPTNQITRAEFTKMLVCAMGYGDFTTEPTEFSDLSDHWAKCYIKTAYDLTIVNGFDDGTFKPDDPVTYEQALKMMVCALGYEIDALGKGSYPDGYISQASELKIDQSIVDQQYKDPALRQVIAQLVYNSLEVKKQEKTNNGSIEVTDKTLLNDNLKIYKLRGTLVGVEDNTTNDCTVALNQFQINILDDSGAENVIDMYEYSSQMSVAEMAKLLGNYINVYYKQASAIDDKELVIVDAETTKNTTYEVSYEDIIEYDGSTLKYFLPNSSTRKNLKVKSGEVTVRYNGQTLEAGMSYTIESKDGTESKSVTKEEAIMEWLNPESKYFVYGDVSMIDSGSTGEINILAINDYDVMIALKTPVTTDYRLQNKIVTGDYLDLNPNQVDKKIYIEKNGKEVQATSISANDIVSYTESLNGEILNLYINTDNKVTGDVSSVNTTEYKIRIGSEEYNLGRTCLDDVYAKEGKSITTNSNITAYMDKLGTVVYATVNTADEIPYAYIANLGMDLGTDEANITVFTPSTSNKGAKRYSLASKVKISSMVDGEYVTKTYTSNEEIANALQASAAYNNDDINYASDIYGSGKTPANTDYSQIARVKINSAGEVSEIIALDNTKDSKQNEDTQVVAKYHPLKKYYYTSNSFKENSKGSTLFSMNSKTLVIFVPQDRNSKDDYAKKAASSATFTSGQSYWVEAYDVNSSRYSNVIILYGTSGSITDVTRTTDISIVSATPSQYYDTESGETVQKVSFFTASNSDKEWITSDATEFADVQIGDVLQFGYDADKKIQKRSKVIDYADIKTVLDGQTTSVTYTNGEESTQIEEVFNWGEEIEQNEEGRYQKYKFDFRFPKTSVSVPSDDYYVTYTSSTYGEIPYTQACMYNVYNVLTDSNKLQVTKEGFDSTTGQMRDAELVDIEEYTISSSTKIIRLESNGTGFSKYVEGTETELSISDLQAATDYGKDCSKVLICARTGSVKLIVIYGSTAN